MEFYKKTVHTGGVQNEKTKGVQNEKQKSNNKQNEHLFIRREI